MKKLVLLGFLLAIGANSAFAENKCVITTSVDAKRSLKTYRLIDSLIGQMDPEDLTYDLCMDGVREKIDTILDNYLNNDSFPHLPLNLEAQTHAAGLNAIYIDINYKGNDISVSGRIKLDVNTTSSFVRKNL